MILSILIASLHGRKAMLDRLTASLYAQIEAAGAQKLVEVIILSDRGEKSIGLKRQQLLKAAAGRYIAFIDDDDTVPEYYISELLKGAASGADCMSLSGIITTDGQDARSFIHALGYKWEERNGTYYRPPNHLNAVKRELALQAGFRDMAYGEDRDYSERLAALKLLRTQHSIAPVMYHYHYVSHKTN